jgi:serine/threonine protein kinase
MQDESPISSGCPFVRIPSVSVRDWYSELMNKVKLGSLTGVIQLYGEYERERSECMFDEDEIFNQCYPDGWTLLHEACRSGYSYIVQYLVTRSANPNQDSEGLTPLIISVQDEKVDCVRSLLRHPRIQVNKMTQKYPPALHIACSKGSSVIVQMLIEHKASMVLEDQRNMIPLQCATTLEIFELIPRYMGEIELLKSKGKLQKLRAETFESELFSVYNDEMVKTTALLEPNKGTFQVSDNTRSEAFHNFVIYDISDVRICNRSFLGLQDWEGFMVYYKNTVFKFFLKDKDEVDAWVQRILNAIRFCQEKKIGFVQDSMNLKNELEIQESVLSTCFIEKPISLAIFNIISEISKCKYGKVFKVIKVDTGEIFAMKQLLKYEVFEDNQLEKIMNENRILRFLSHPFVIKLHFSFQNEKNLFLVYDFCSRGTLESRLNSAKKLTEVESKSILCQVILALEYLHSLDIIFREIKPSNILIDSNGMIKLFNFHLAKEGINSSNKAYSFCGTPAYFPPEIFLKTGYDKPIDIYSIGVLLFEMLNGTPPFFSDKIKEIFRNIIRGSLFFPNFFSNNSKELIKLMMSRDPSKRPSLEKIKNHHFFEDIDWEDIEIKKYRKTEEKIEKDPKRSSTLDPGDIPDEDQKWFIKGFNFSRMSANFCSFNQTANLII